MKSPLRSDRPKGFPLPSSLSVVQAG